MGVRVSDTNPETRIATLMVTANSCSRRPTIPPRNSTGMKTATSEIVMDTMVNPISRAPTRAASIRGFPSSMWRTMFSSITIASSTTKPTESVSAISDRLSTVYPSRYMAANVPTIANGTAKLGMTVADTFRRNRKMTITTRQIVNSSVNFTSEMDSRMEIERS